jgi:hypothetical protein
MGLDRVEDVESGWSPIRDHENIRGSDANHADAQSDRREILTLIDGVVLVFRTRFVTHEEGRRTVAVAGKNSDRD